MLNIEPKHQIKQIKSYICLYNEIYALIKRLYIQIQRRPSMIISGIIQPLLWLLLFGALFQNAPVGLFTKNMQYSSFLIPGIIVFTSFTGSINGGLPLMFDREFGFLNRLLISPLVSRDALLISSIFFISTITLIQTFIIILCSCLLFDHSYGTSELLHIAIVICLICLSTGSISICLAFILPGHIEFLAFILIVNLPMLFSSTALAPLSFMPYWLQTVASINPLTYAIESIRHIIEPLNISGYATSIETAWINIGFDESLYILVTFNLLSFIITKNIISYKFE